MNKILQRYKSENMTDTTFDAAFEALTGHLPLRWQLRLFNLLRSGKIPQRCDIPTGLGKTSVIPIWLIALSQQAAAGRITLPRRLVYIINRRTVVDQATTVVEQMRERLLCPAGTDWSTHETVLRSIASSMQLMTFGPPLIAVSTLRGEFADNEEWKQDPSRAAVIVGTIDMIGSKLLFNGYGDGQYHRVHHAGLLGQDALLVHDEAHLAPAFSDLLMGVAKEQRKDCELRPIHVMELSATPRSSGDDHNTIRLDIKDESDGIVMERLDATKTVHLHGCANRRNLPQTMADLALRHDDLQAKVLLYVRTPRDAQTLGRSLSKKLKSDERIALLTGTMRGYERDKLAQENPAYQKFLDQEEECLAKSVYLISTSAGEVGIDIDADHLICDVTTLDSMIQRLGRVNRRGGTGRVAQVDVVWTEEDENTKKDRSVAKTLEILRRWIQDQEHWGDTVNASPRNIGKLMRKLDSQDLETSFSPKPVIPPLSDILLDAWSLTSVNRMPGRPEVAAYLHGLTNDPPTTYVVWRKELSLLSKSDVDKGALQGWFDSCRVRANERLQIRTDILRTELRGLTKTHRKNEDSQDYRVVLLDERNQAEWALLSQLGAMEVSLEYKTVVLPTDAGGLGQYGIFDSSVSQPAPDVADSDIDGIQRARWLCRSGEYEPLVSASDLGSAWDEYARLLLASSEGLVTEDDAEAGKFELILRMPKPALALASPDIAKTRQTLTAHTETIMYHAKAISERLALTPSVASALVTATYWHDKGKDRKIWQRYARNHGDGSISLAKSEDYLHWRVLSGYRHEFGSLLDALHDPSLCDNPERELVLHLIAAHHGHARPCFGIRAFDKEKFSTAENNQTNVEVMQRFGLLQKRFGRWGLAWLESIVRCADALASQPQG